MMKRALLLCGIALLFLVALTTVNKGTALAATALNPSVEQEEHLTYKDVNYLDLLWGKGYAIPYHLKRFNFYDLFVDWGGSTATLLRFDFNKDKNRQKKDTVRDIQRLLLYVYANVRYQNWFRYYVKFRNIYHGHDYYPDDNKFVGPDVDQMYGEFLFEPFNLVVGRQFHKVGRGHVYRNNFDAIKLMYSDDFMDIDMYIGKVLGDNQDPYIPNNQQNKYPIGITATYKEFMKHLFQGYIVGVMDRSDDQLYYRNSNYKPVYFGTYGIGRFDINKYKIRSLTYYFETVKTIGTSSVSDFSPAANRYDSETIDTFLLDLGAIIRIDHPWKPEIENEFVWGSGDGTVPLYGDIQIHPSSATVDQVAQGAPGFVGVPTLYKNQRGNVSSILRGNPKGSKDQNWRGIDGYVNYGVALNPIVSNMLIYKFGAKLYPIKRLTIDINSYAYWKQHADGAISDYAAILPGRTFIGNEIDIGFMYDLTRYSRATFVYGHFFTGNVYPNNAHTDEDFLQLVYQYVF
ncbi:MAG: alginate export family protein [Candidatus Ancaeobacter aquaticus]|nr:alginate export family protein [Candidatus Ancaeobacter aquaticus]